MERSHNRELCKQLMHETSVTSKKTDKKQVTQFCGYKITALHSRFWINTQNVLCVWNLTKGQVCIGNRCSNTSLIPGLFLKYSEYSVCGPQKADCSLPVVGSILSTVCWRAKASGYTYFFPLKYYAQWQWKGSFPGQSIHPKFLRLPKEENWELSA